MKLLKIFLLTMFMTVSAHAETITVIVTGKPGGTFHARSMLYVEELTKLGWDTNIIQAGSCVKAEQIVKNTDDPVIMAWNSGSNAGKCDIMPTEENFIGLDYVAPMLWCSIYDSRDALINFFAEDEPIAFATGASYNRDIFDQLALELGKPMKIITYKNSGSALKGFIGGDADYIFTNLGKATKIVNGGHGECFLSSGTTKINEVPQMSEIMPSHKYAFLQQNAFVIGANLNEDILFSLVEDFNVIYESSAFNEYIATNNFTHLPLPREDAIEVSRTGAYLWGRPLDK